MDSRTLKIAAVCGISAPSVALVCILSAIASWSQFSWVDNALSDLGVQAGATALVFNSGLVVTGLLCLVFAVGLFRFAGKRSIGKVGSVVFALACVALVCIGVFNESFVPTHYLVSVAFFVFLPISLLIFVGGFWLMGEKRLSVFTLIVGLVAAAVWILEFTVHYVPGVAIPEFISAFAGGIWAEVLSFKMLKLAKPSSAS